MADALDPVLESLLRTTLREEAASIPFRLRAEDVRPKVARTGGPGWRPIMLVAAMALVGLAAGGVLLAGAFRPVPRVESSAPPAVTGAFADVPSFDRLLGLLEFDHEIARAEGFTESDSTTVVEGTEVTPWTELLLGCSGPGLELGGPDGGPRAFEPTVDCATGVMRMPVGWPNPKPGIGLSVRARGGTAWRLIVVGRDEGIPERPAGTAAIGGLPSFDELASSVGRPMTEVVRGSGTAGPGDTSFRLSLPKATTDPIVLVLACSTGPAQFSVGTADEVDVGFGFATVPCDQQTMRLDLRAGPTGPAWSVIHLRLQEGNSWAAVVLTDPPSAGSLEP